MRGVSPFFLVLVAVTGVGAALAAVGIGAVLVTGIVLLVLGVLTALRRTTTGASS